MNKTMKKLPLLGLLVCLAGCGEATPIEAGSVKKGKEIPVEVAKQQMQAASVAMESKDAFSVRMENASFNYSLSMEKNIPTGKESNTSIKMNHNTKIDKVNAAVGFTGLTSDKVEDVKGYGEVKANVDINGATNASGFQHSYQTPKGTVGFTCYQDGATTYLDLSDNKLQGVVNTVVKEGLFNKNLSFGLSSDTKIAIPNTIDADDMPVISDKDMNRITYEITDEIEDIASRGGTVKALQHDDGTYSYSVETKNLEDADDFEDLIEADFDFDVDDDMGYPNIKPSIENNVNVKTYSIAYVFNQNGISSIGATIDIDYTFKSSLTINNTVFSTEIKMNCYFNGKINFDYGNDVIIKEVQDKDAYKVCPRDFELFD